MSQNLGSKENLINKKYRVDTLNSAKLIVLREKLTLQDINMTRIEPKTERSVAVDSFYSVCCFVVLTSHINGETVVDG